MAGEINPRDDTNTVTNTENNGSSGNLRYPTVSGFNPETFRERSLHEVMASHILTCSECERASKETLPAPNVRVSGPARSKMCNIWFGLLQAYSDWEGRTADVRGPEAVSEEGWRNYGHPEA